MGRRQQNQKQKNCHHLFLFLLLLLFSVNKNGSSSIISTTTLDPTQLTALKSIGLIPISDLDPCSNPSPHNNATSCDSSSPFRHLISLHLSNCSSDHLSLSPSSLLPFHHLLSLSFFRCRNINIRIPSSLLSFSSISSSPFLLSPFPHNLTHLFLKDLLSPLPSSFLIRFSNLPNLLNATVSNATLSAARLPRRYRSQLSLIHLDLSFNNLKGPLPLSNFTLLRFLNLTSNSLSGSIPETMSAMPELEVIDLSFNRFNGSVPSFLAEMRSLRWLNLERNDFEGVIPFNASFVERLEVFKAGGNRNLCYNRSVLSMEFMVGIAPCDKYGFPVPPPPGKEEEEEEDDSFADYDYGGGEGEDKDGGGRHGVNKLVLGLAIGLSCLLFLVFFLLCLSKLCG